MRQLVREHALDLSLVETPHEPGRHRDDGVLRVPAGRECVGHVRVDDRNLRHRQLCHRGEPLDRVEQLRCLVALDHLRPGRAQRELVGGVVLEERHAHHDQDQRGEPDVEDVGEHGGERDVEQTQHEAGEEHPGG